MEKHMPSPKLNSYVENIRNQSRLRKNRENRPPSTSPVKNNWLQEKKQYCRLLAAATQEIKSLQKQLCERGVMQQQKQESKREKGARFDLERQKDMLGKQIQRLKLQKVEISKKHQLQRVQQLKCHERRFSELKSFYEALQNSIVQKHAIEIANLNRNQQEQLASQKVLIQRQAALVCSQLNDSSQSLKVRICALELQISQLRAQLQARVVKESRQVQTQDECERLLAPCQNESYQVKQLKLSLRRKTQLCQRLLARLQHK